MLTINRTKGKCKYKILPYTGMGNIVDDTPITRITLRILAPKILPIEISYAFFLKEVIDVISSGNDVPKAVIVKPIIISGTPKKMAIFSPLVINNLEPESVNRRPKENINNFNNIFFVSIFFSLLFTFWFVLLL